MNLNKYLEDNPINENTIPKAAFHRDIKAIKKLYKLKAPINMKLVLDEMYADECHYDGEETYIYDEDVEILRLLFKWEREEEESNAR